MMIEEWLYEWMLDILYPFPWATGSVWDAWCGFASVVSSLWLVLLLAVVALLYLAVSKMRKV